MGSTTDHIDSARAGRRISRLDANAAIASTRDGDIRRLLRSFVREEHAGHPNTLYLEEFAMFGGDARADLAALNGVSHGYEIKSGRDTLERLPRQVSAYSAVFEQVTFVGTYRHINVGRPLFPAWWGIVCIAHGNDGIALKRVRKSRPNPKPDTHAIAALLWRGEALDILERAGVAKGLKSKPMAILMDRIARHFTADQLGALVREAMGARADWLAGQQRSQCDA